MIILISYKFFVTWLQSFFIILNLGNYLTYANNDHNGYYKSSTYSPSYHYYYYLSYSSRHHFNTINTTSLPPHQTHSTTIIIIIQTTTTKQPHDHTGLMFFEPMLMIPLAKRTPFSLQSLSRAAVCSAIKYDDISRLPVPKSLVRYLQYYHYKQRVRVRRF